MEAHYGGKWTYEQMLDTVQKAESKVEVLHVGARLPARTQHILCSGLTSSCLQSVDHPTFNQTRGAWISVHV